tara:strand:+ start:51 stop:755 length:705 start_codon:yes stop_codon:yes gene_type:complete
MKKKLLNLFIFLLILSSCEIDSKDYFPFSNGTKWLYSIKINSSYTGKEYEKRLMITNVNSKKKNNIVEVSKLHSDGSFYTYEINKQNNQITRSSVILAFGEGLVEPVKKIIYPDLQFNQKEWIIKEQLFLLKGFQPPLLNVKPRSKFDMRYKVNERFDNLKINGKNYKFCLMIQGNGKTSFIGDTRSGPIKVEIINYEWICDGVGVVKQKREEKTNASAFGNMTLEKYLLSFDN